MPKAANEPVFKRPRSKFWQLRWTAPDGREIRRSSRTESFTEACAQLKQLKVGSGLSVSEVSKRFLAHHKMSSRTRECYRGSLHIWEPYVGHLMVDQVTKLHIQRFVSDRLKRVKPSSIRNNLACMSSLMRFSSQLPGGSETNPVRDFDKSLLKASEERVRWLEPEEVTRLLEKIPNDRYRLIALFGLEAGLRRKEILNMKVHNLNLTEHYILLQGKQTKGKRGRRVPLSKVLQRALSAHKMGDNANDWMFPNPETNKPYYDLHFWWDKAVEDAGIKDFTFHDTRHHFASRYVQRGGRLETLRRILGHGTIRMTERYAHLTDPDAEAEFRRIEEHTLSRT